SQVADMAGRSTASCGDRGSIVLPFAAAPGGQGSAVDRKNGGAGAARVDSPGASENWRAHGQGQVVLGHSGAGRDAACGDRGFAAFRRSGASREAGVEYAAGGARGPGSADLAARCSAAGVLHFAGWHGNRGFFRGVGDVDSVGHSERADGGGLDYANAGSERAASAATKDSDPWTGSGFTGGAPGFDTDFSSEWPRPRCTARAIRHIHHHAADSKGLTKNKTPPKRLDM